MVAQTMSNSELHGSALVSTPSLRQTARLKTGPLSGLSGHVLSRAVCRKHGSRMIGYRIVIDCLTPSQIELLGLNSVSRIYKCEGPAKVRMVAVGSRPHSVSPC